MDTQDARALTVDPTRVEEFLIAVSGPGAPARARPDPLMGRPVPPGFLFYVSSFGAEAVHERVGVTYQNGLFAGTSVRVHAPVRVGDRLTVRAAPGRRRGTSGLAFTEVHCEYLREGEVVMAETSTVVTFGAGQPGATGRGPGRRTAATEPDASARGKDGAVVTGPFCADRFAVAYMAVALRDPNPVHLDDEFATSLGLAAPILHGTFAIYHLVSAVVGEQWDRLAGFTVRLRSPIQLDEQYWVSRPAHQPGDEPTRVVARTADGRTVGEATVTTRDTEVVR